MRRWRDRSSAVRREISNGPRSCFNVRCRTLYLARQVFPDAEIPYQALDSLPLAAEPFAAALDLVLSFVSTEATRGALIELLRCSHWSFGPADSALSPADIAAADGLLRDVKYVGGWDRLLSLAAEAGQSSGSNTDRTRSSTWTRAAPALAAAASAATELRGLADAPLASAQLAALRAFITAHERLPSPADEWYGRHLRARAAILSALESLTEAHRLHDDERLPLPELAGTLRRWIESQTFSPRTGAHGVSLLDATAAACADVDEVHIVGLVDSDWPDRGRRSIFYPPSLLAQLGWPVDADRLSAARARFHDLLRLPRARVAVSLFTLEDDAIVPASAFVEELESAGLPVERMPNRPLCGSSLTRRSPGSRSSRRRSEARRWSGWRCGRRVRRRSMRSSTALPVPGNPVCMR